MSNPTRIVVLLIFAGFLAACAVPQSGTVAVSPPLPPAKPKLGVPAEPWLLVDAKADTLTVMKGNRTLEVFDNIALGIRGAGIKHQRGDEITPVGTFRVGWVNPRSRFKLFFGLDYPNREYADRAYQQGRINTATYSRIINALEQGKTPPQNTPLGGQIGIHGVGAGDPEVHEYFNWTAGCIALDNAQIERLAKWVRIGTQVKIRG
ncbi:MAG: L,D-transpeptidase [Candidatus Competibacteraceae bacterium]|jgi:murein L,D-transpeptidase YafK|nr:L,D-transpeptidase [Candidatus Competibacteraceae bacterium]